jgi:hypothetical protein
MRYFILVVTHIAAVVAGFALGAYMISRDVIPAASMLVDGLQITRYADNVVYNRENGTEDQYRTALYEYIGALDRIDYDKNPILDKNTYLLDMALTYARLSKLEARVGNDNESTEHLRTALKACSSLDIDWCTSEKLINAVEKLDGESSNKSLNQIDADNAPPD